MLRRRPKTHKKFNYNDIKSLEKQIKKYKNKIACVVLEPSSTECPKIKKDDKPCCNLAKCNRDYKNKDHFLKQVEKICKKKNSFYLRWNDYWI